MTHNLFEALDVKGEGKALKVATTPDISERIKAIYSEEEKVRAETKGEDRVRSGVKRVIALMKILATSTSRAPMPLTQFRNEGRYSSGDPTVGEISIFAIKGDQVRLYGGYVTIEDGLGKKCIFLCTEMDASKKQNKADVTILKAAAKKLVPYIKAARSRKEVRHEKRKE